MKLPFDGKSITTLGEQASSKSAVNPSLWACLVISLPLFFFSTEISGILRFCFIVIAFLPVATFIVSYLYLLFKNPRYLRSEEYQLRAEAMGLFGNKDNPLNADATDVISVINNPLLPAPKKYD